MTQAYRLYEAQQYAISELPTELGGRKAVFR